MKKWEYKELNFEVKYRLLKKPHTIYPEDYIQQLNDEGKKGWEVIQIIPHAGSSYYEQEMTIILKREIQGMDKSFF